MELYAESYSICLRPPARFSTGYFAVPAKFVYIAEDVCIYDLGGNAPSGNCALCHFIFANMQIFFLYARQNECNSVYIYIQFGSLEFQQKTIM